MKTKVTCNHSGISIAVLLILIGGIFLLFNTGMIPLTYKSIIFSWQMLLIGLGLWSFFKRKYIGALFLITIGGFFIYPLLVVAFPGHFVNINIDFQTYWPILLIIAGVFLLLGRIFRGSGRKNNKGKFRTHSTFHSLSENPDTKKMDYIDKNMMFGSSSNIILSHEFKGGEANVMFGELIIDLRKAVLAYGEQLLEVNVMFGNMVLLVPETWKVEIKSNTFLGALEDKRITEHKVIPEEDKNTLFVEINCILANAEIRN
ncbi:MAG: cell wall-active antibiotics response protein [Candidatus Azobacteroides sp.]|nr:cell wall-active antibiotics response protein [Candidatus Azobacteroides sp.]